MNIPVYLYEANDWFLKEDHLTSYSDNHMMPTHTHTHTHTAICCTLTPPYLFQTVPHTAHTMGHRLKINCVMSIELKCEEI